MLQSFRPLIAVGFTWIWGDFSAFLACDETFAAMHRVRCQRQKWITLLAVLCSGRWSHPSCCWRTWSSVAVLRGARAAGVALCYGNNNRGACEAGSVHPLAPNMAPISPWLFSCPAILSNKRLPPSLCFCSLPRSLRLPLTNFPTSFSLTPLSLPVYFSPSLSSQFHPFFCPTKTLIHPSPLEANKMFTENAKCAQKMPLQSGFLP